MQYGYGYFINSVYRNQGQNYGVDLQNAIDYALTQSYALPTAQSLAILDTLLLYQNQNAIFTELDLEYLLAQDFEPGETDFRFTHINLVSPGDFTLTEVGSPVFTRKQGYSSPSGLNALNTNFTPSVDAVNYTLNAASFMYWQFDEAVPDGNQQYACGGNTSLGRCLDSGGTQTINAINTPGNIAAAPFVGLHHVNRSAANLMTLFKEGISYATSSTASTSLPTLPQFICARTADGSTANNPYRRDLSLYALGGNLNAKAPEVYTGFSNYMTSMNA